MTALADFIRTVFNTSQSAAPQLAPAHLGYRVHVHMEKNKAGCLLCGGGCQLDAATSALMRLHWLRQDAAGGSKTQRSAVLEALERQCLLGHTLMVWSPGRTVDLRDTCIADPALCCTNHSVVHGP